MIRVKPIVEYSCALVLTSDKGVTHRVDPETMTAFQKMARQKMEELAEDISGYINDNEVRCFPNLHPVYKN